VYATDTAPFTDILLENEFIAQAPRAGAPLPSEDSEKLRDMRDRLIELCKGAEFLIYDTQFTPEEYRAKPHWGHSTPLDAIEIANAAQVKTLALFHHDPTRTDDAQDKILEETRHIVRGSGLEVIAAAEQQEVKLGE
jgi:ribonuclease BN (tRNA processing enzyme)